MTERPKFFDDLAGVAGGAMSALAGLREEAESTIRARVEDIVRRLDLVRREDLEAVQEMAANARAAQELLESRVAALEAKLAAMPQATTLPAAAGATSGAVASASASAFSDTVDAPPPMRTGPGSEGAP